MRRFMCCPPYWRPRYALHLACLSVRRNAGPEKEGKKNYEPRPVLHFQLTLRGNVRSRAVIWGRYPEMENIRDLFAVLYLAGHEV